MTIQGTTLNPADVATGAGTHAPILSNGNLTVAGTNTGAGQMAIRSVGSAAAGQFTFSVTMKVRGNSSVAMGVLENSVAMNTFIGGGFPGSFLWKPDGSTLRNGAASTTLAAWNNAGDVATLFVNLATGMVWGKVNDGAWNLSLSDSPALGIGGIALTGITAPVSPVAWMLDNAGTGAQITYGFTVADNTVPASPSTMLVWARGIKQIPGTQLWGAGGWTNVYAGTLPGGPESGQGGVYMGGLGLQPDSFTRVYLTAQGTGDAGIFIRTGPPFRVLPPRGFAWGWPGGNGGPFGRFDPATAKGSAVVDGTGLGVSFPTTDGLVQSAQSIVQGSYYVEFTATGDIFTQKQGVGFGRLGPTLAAWFNAGGFSSTDNNGGAMLDGGSIATGYQATLNANTVLGPNLPNFLTPPQADTAIGVAVTVTNDFALTFQAPPFQPVPLVCVPCIEYVLPNQRFKNRFGR